MANASALAVSVGRLPSGGAVKSSSPCAHQGVLGAAFRSARSLRRAVRSRARRALAPDWAIAHNGCDRASASVGVVEQEQGVTTPPERLSEAVDEPHLSTVRSGALGGGDGSKQLSLLSAFGEVTDQHCSNCVSRCSAPRATHLAHPGRTAQQDAACALFEAPLHLVHCGLMPDGCVLVNSGWCARAAPLSGSKRLFKSL